MVSVDDVGADVDDEVADVRGKVPMLALMLTSLFCVATKVYEDGAGGLGGRGCS